MSRKEVKYEITLQEVDLTNFFHELSKLLDGRTTEDFQDKLLAFSKLKCEVKRKKDRIGFSLKVKCEPDNNRSDFNEGNAKISYSTLKKRMKKSFKAIEKDLERNQVPEPTILRLFLDDSHLMLSFSGCGDDYYKDYLTACEELERALQSGELDSVKKAYYTVNKVKSQCHDKYK